MYEEEFEIREEVVHDDFYGVILPPRKEHGINLRITHEDLQKIHYSQRDEWFNLDLTLLDTKIPILPDKTPLRKLSETPPDLFKILRDRKKKSLKNP